MKVDRHSNVQSWSNIDLICRQLIVATPVCLPTINGQWHIQSGRHTLSFPFLHCRPAWWLTNFIIYGLKWYMTALNWGIIKYFLFVKYFWSNKAIIHYGTTGKTTAFICCHKCSVYGVLFCWLYWRRPRDAHKPRLYHYLYLSSVLTLKS